MQHFKCQWEFRGSVYLYTPGQSRASDSVDSVGYRQTGGHLLPRIPAAFPWAHIVQSWAAERGGLWRLQCGMCRVQDTGYQYWYWSIHTPGHSLIKHCLWAKWGITNTIQLQCQVQLWMAMAINVCDISTYISICPFYNSDIAVNCQQTLNITPYCLHKYDERVQVWSNLIIMQCRWWLWLVRLYIHI